ncbi:pantetheine-phosphate adenylyltransferase [Campylobacter canadensis]|uniref:Phosphopantetheine adenylyltransferase n=1 Tax=Campylobacter canadensis TaxID=449520 RepID=A0ABS7WSG6_9BACT|nr:pantetheine-phosphate adenylyltransferase [Campylobacter canadensis]MBZ7987004.1 pantetheine-phosphate adenylyltransferase [Campylobacter canadensis]MBZ7995276.1 pantetheine-phosphate adenylyltransferase [Campylobacter canadensis]MBZ7997182.1 pantetheine-phosphate adenylyltransferase [Campylobacter canadensis]MBZ7998040.1 pantetheine-phosphate adenylyltransferase [Campylobacter canadensis]MBZ8000691.1 pantetheine-phosphate adenylyltransferase [Campylobacter canadensis]
MKKAIYPGTFDPITNGHLDVIKRALGIFDELIIAVAKSDKKNPYYDLQTRLSLVKKATKGLNVKVLDFSCLLVDFAKKQEVYTIIRGLRAVSDFEYELQMHYANASLNKKIETIYLMPSLENAFISSSIVRSIKAHNGDISNLIPKEILKDIM